jgi:hypothetical protein
VRPRPNPNPERGTLYLFTSLVSIYKDNSYLVAVYPLNLVDEVSDSRNDSSLMLILKSIDLIELCVLTYYVQCLNIAVVTYLSTLLEWG